MNTLAEALRHLSREELDEGRTALLALIAAEPDNAGAWAYLSGVHLADGKATEAQAAVDRALALDPDGFSANIKAGELSLRLGDLGLADERFVKALRAVEPGTSRAAAAKRALVIVREQSRRSITHDAALPRLRLPTGWLRRRPAAMEDPR
jgi:predicted Zn-dependent protease